MWLKQNSVMAYRYLTVGLFPLYEIVVAALITSSSNIAQTRRISTNHLEFGGKCHSVHWFIRSFTHQINDVTVRTMTNVNLVRHTIMKTVVQMLT